MSARHLSAVFNPASVALIGASERPGSLGEALARNLLTGDFKGEAHFVNRRHRRILDRPAYHHIAEAPGAPELAIIATPPLTVPRLLAEVGQHGVKAVVIATPSHPDNGDPTALSRATLLAAAHPYDLRLLGPGGGVIAPGRGCNASLAPAVPPPGGLALVCQANAVLPPLIAWASAQGCGLSHLIVLGEQIDIDFADVLDWLAEDADTQVILLALETVERARPFLSAARAAARVKPVLAVRAGRGHDAASRHTDAVYDAALRRAGVLRLPSLRELFWTALTLSLSAPIAGDRLAVVGNSRWLGLLAADALLAEQGRLSRWRPDAENALRSGLPPDLPLQNPLDLGDAADARRYAAVLPDLLRDPNADGLLVLHAPNARVSAEDVAAAVAETVRRHDEGGDPRPAVLACWPGADDAPGVRQRLRESRIPIYATPDDAVQAFMRCWRRQQNRVGLATTPAVLSEPAAEDRAAARRIVEAALAADRDVLEPAEASALLRAHGLSVSAASATSVPGSTARSPLTFGIRMVEDALFGPVLWLAAERAGVAADAVAVLPPLDSALAREALRSSTLYRLLREADSTQPGTLDALISVLVNVSGLVVDVGEIVELDLHPVVVNAAGATVENARIRLAATESASHDRLAIRPYPRDLEELLPLPDGSTLLIRPVRPEDEPIFVASFRQLSTEEVRMRFMRAVTELAHEEAARLTRIDYDRDLALVVFRQRLGQPLESCGVARLMRAADGERAEFAIVLLRAATGIGLGSLLLRRLIHQARARGFRELFGEILRENEPMLALCRAMGFQIAVCPEDSGLMIARLPLA